MAWSDNKKGISSFSVILTMVILSIIGLGLVPLVGIQYAPSAKSTTISVNFSWEGSSAKVLESEVTSKLEGVLSTISNLEDISSSSKDGVGWIELKFKKDVSVEAARFDAINKIRQIYSYLPDGVTFPEISMGRSNSRDNEVMLTYTLNSSLPTNMIEQYADQNIIVPLSEIKGISKLELSGVTPFDWVIKFDYNKADILGITSNDIRDVINNNFRLNEIAGQITNSEDKTEVVKITSSEKINQKSIEKIVFNTKDGRIVTLSDIAKVSFQESVPNSYYRINGLNTVNLSISAEPGVNTLTLTTEIKNKIEELEKSFINNFSMMLSYDSSEYIKEELDKIYLRTIISILILLTLVALASRSLKYTLLIVITLAANVLVAFILYYLLKLELHIYSLAGITVSLGIIIDTAIMMIDHYRFYRNRTIFYSILGALLTTIGSLVIVFFLPQEERNNLVDFSLVIIINLSVSILIAYLFVPALMDKIKLVREVKIKNRKTIKRVIAFNRGYEKYINFGRKRKWLFIVVIIIAFGLPVHLIPTEMKWYEMENKEHRETYNKIFGSDLYVQTIKPVTDVALGGTLRLFTKSLNNFGGFREPTEIKLSIVASMQHGCTIHQLNDVMLSMENYLSQFDEIKMFQTRISSYDNGKIVVTFKDPDGTFPYILKDLAIKKAINSGGASWSIYGVGNESFNNNIGNTSYYMYGFIVKGYGYEQLYKIAEQVKDSISQHRRVKDANIKGSPWEKIFMEYYVDYDREKVANRNFDASQYFSYLTNQLYSNQITRVLDNNIPVSVELVSNQINSFDLWHIKNALIKQDSMFVKMNDFGTIEKKASGNAINKKNQEYELYVQYNFVGSSKLETKFNKDVLDKYEKILPVGYTIEDKTWGYRDRENDKYKLLFIVILIIYFICAIMFESLFKPLVIITLIPISFIGLFLTFIIGEFFFDQGGYASFVMLSGLVVNAGIYLIYEYMSLGKKSPNYSPVKLYMKSYNRKIIPISLTIISTVLSLIPFLISGDKEVFWFSFAAGAIGGIAFSLVALILFLPVLMLPKRIDGDVKSTKTKFRIRFFIVYIINLLVRLIKKLRFTKKIENN